MQQRAYPALRQVFCHEDLVKEPGFSPEDAQGAMEEFKRKKDRASYDAAQLGSSKKTSRG